MSNERFRIAADIIVMDWKQTTDVTRDAIDIHLTNEDILIDLITKELIKEHNDTTEEIRNNK